MKRVWFEDALPCLLVTNFEKQRIDAVTGRLLDGFLDIVLIGEYLYHVQYPSAKLYLRCRGSNAPHMYSCLLQLLYFGPAQSCASTCPAANTPRSSGRLRTLSGSSSVDRGTSA